MKLKPPQGCASISLGGTSHVLGPDGLFDVPEEAALLLIQSHGFARADSARPENARATAAPKKGTGKTARRSGV